MNRKKYELEKRIYNGEFGQSTKFFYSAEKEFRLVSDFSAYDAITQKFERLKQDLKLMLEQRRSSTSQDHPQAKLNMLTEKYKTPFDKRTYTAIPKETEASSSESNRSKKRAAEEAQPLDDKSTKSQLESPSLVRLNKLVPKTPITNRLSSRLHVHSS
ncbi:hypothetical protein BpHYR1_046608, partial [Brachionus plicatilis]